MTNPWRTALATQLAIERAQQFLVDNPSKTKTKARIDSFMYITDGAGKPIPEDKQMAAIVYVGEGVSQLEHGATAFQRKQGSDK